MCLILIFWMTQGIFLVWKEEKNPTHPCSLEEGLPVFPCEIYYSNAAAVRAARAMVWQGKGTEGMVKQTRDCNICGELMGGGVLLSIPTRYWWKTASPGAPGKHQSGTAQKTKCLKILGSWSRALRRWKPCCLKRGFRAAPGSRVRRDLAAHSIHSFLVDGTAKPRQIPSYPKGLSTATPHRAGGSGLALGGIWCWWA